MELQEGIYSHFKDGHLYQVLFLAELIYDKVEQNDAVAIYVNESLDIRAYAAYMTPDFPSRLLFTGRAHGLIQPGTTCVIYVPLYAHKPGRRVAVRPLSEFIELMPVEWEMTDDRDPSRFEPRFKYVGQEMPG